jgi:16S rRNA (cytosine967-C5)-methyltransferase
VALLNTPGWLWERWTKAYGVDGARLIGLAHADRPGLDLSFRSDPAALNESLGGTLLPNGQLRLPSGHAPVPELGGFREGGWWVQDAAATIPVHLLGELAGKRVLDLCAAPGGKTLQMAAMGAQVTAIDVSDNRLHLLRANLARMGLEAEVRVEDMLSETLTGEWDAVLLDAPCSATGTIRRHPELPHLKQEKQIGELTGLQRSMLRKAATLVKPGGMLVYCTCSLEPEEGEAQVKWFLRWSNDFELLQAALPWLPLQAVSAEGWVRTLPFMKLGEAQGLDGFFAAVLRRRP